MGWFSAKRPFEGVGAAAKKAEGVKGATEGEEVEGEEGSVPVPVRVVELEVGRRLKVSMMTRESTKVGGGLGSTAAEELVAM